MKVLVTGGAGYIGSHTIFELLEQGHEVTCVDNYVNSSPEALRRVEDLSGREVIAHEIDIRDTEKLSRAVGDFCPDAVIHFAGLKAVGESAEKPVDYYDVNVAGTLSLLRAMYVSNCKRIVFSSSATVYGEPKSLPCNEEHPLAPTNVYGYSKLFAEQILSDWSAALAGSSVMLLRYFNPVGAHSSGRIGEDPAGVPSNLMPYISQVAAGRLKHVQIFGDDYQTPDGTGVRDYIHVVDLAKAHIAALERSAKIAGQEVYNIGTGRGYSVREVLSAFSSTVGRQLPFEVTPRRPGDISEIFADPEKAAKFLNWRARLGIGEMVSSHWNWQSRNPMGYLHA